MLFGNKRHLFFCFAASEKLGGHILVGVDENDEKCYFLPCFLEFRRGIYYNKSTFVIFIMK